MRRLILILILTLPTSAQRRDGACAYGIDGPRVHEAKGYERFFIADFDGDGRLDVGTAGVREFQIRYGLDGGTLSEPRKLALRVIDVGDLAGDALPDLLLHGFSIAENRGGEAFAAPKAVAGARGTHILGNFTGDGKANLVFLSAVGNTLTLHGREAQFLPEPARAMAVANVNGDAIQDLLLLHAGGRRISVWRGTASGAFELVESFVPGGIATHVVAADLDGDGRTETIARVQGHLEILGGRFDDITPPRSGAIADMQVHDFNGDGADDLLVDGVVFLNEEGHLREAAPPVAAYPSAPIAAGDFTGDGAAELVVPTYSGYAIVPPFADAPRPLPEVVQGYGHAVVDMNGDGLEDVVFGRDRAVHVAISDGAGGFALQTLPKQYWRAILGATPEEIAVIEAGNHPRTVDVFRRGADGAWQLARTIVAAEEAVTARTADLDGDGVTEAIVIENNLLSGPIPFPDDYRLKIFSGATGALLFEREHGSRKIEVEAADLNADGATDVLMAMHGGRQPTELRVQTVRDGFVQALYGVHGGTLRDPVLVAIRVLPRAPRTGDFNGDGRRDVAYLDDWALVAHYGTAGGFNVSSPIAPAGPYASDLAAADLNGDGITDVVANGGSEITLAAGSRQGLVAVGKFYGALSLWPRTSLCRAHRRSVRH